MRCPLADRHDWQLVGDDPSLPLRGEHFWCPDCDAVSFPGLLQPDDEPVFGLVGAEEW